MIEIFYLFFAYILGSIPFGYIFTKIFAKKNILEIGWKKTSGSNVFKNIGRIPGALTGIFDLLKGFFAVWLAKNFNFPSSIQILAGVAAVSGHNWSIFLKFAGGRGIGTFVGAALSLSPKLLGFSIIPLIILGIIWNASIGTIFFLMTTIILSLYFNQFEPMGLFSLLSLLPIFIKRLSPIGEIKEKKDLIKNRLIFDNDEPCLDLRIKKIISRLTRK